MCMKYINAVVTPYKSAILTPSNAIFSLTAPLKTVKCETVNEHTAMLEEFVIVTDINFLGTAENNHKSENPMVRGDTMDFIIRLTKCAQDPKKRVYMDLDCFSVDLSQAKNEKLASQACFDFYNFTRITRMDETKRHILLKEGKALTGKYVLKLIIVKDGKEIVQSITALDVTDSGKEDTVSLLWQPGLSDFLIK